MIKTGNLGKYEVLSLMILVSIADAVLIYPQQLVKAGGAAGWMIPLLSMGICLGVWAVAGPIFSRGKNMFSAEGTFRETVVAVSVAIAVAYIFIDLVSFTRSFNEVVITTVLPRSPLSFIAIPFFLVAVYYAYMGPEGLSRSALFFLPWTLGGFLLLLILCLNWVKMDYLFPFLGKGTWPLANNSVLFSGAFTNVLYLGFLASRLREPAAVRKIGLLSIVVIGVVYSLVTLVYILVFSAEGAAGSPFAMYQLGRLIYIGRFIHRLEAAFVFIWVVSAMIKTAFSIWMIAYLLAAVSRMPVYRPLVFPVTISLYGAMFLPQSFPETIEVYNRYKFPWGWSIVLGVPLLLSLYARYQKQREERGGRNAA